MKSLRLNSLDVTVEQRRGHSQPCHKFGKTLASTVGVHFKNSSSIELLTATSNRDQR